MEQALFRGDSSEAIATAAEQIGEKLRQALLLVEDVGTAGAELAVHPVPDVATASGIQAILKARRKRAKHFDDDLFADPAWDMLLELYAAELAQEKISVTALCIGASVPQTTALRWMTALEKRALLVRQADPVDGRRAFVKLSDEGKARVAAYFRDVSAIGLPI